MHNDELLTPKLSEKKVARLVIDKLRKGEMPLLPQDISRSIQLHPRIIAKLLNAEVF